jgi:PHD/YefM family antitoxin component YafN of YafNO toxin-antitoxin module
MNKVILDDALRAKLDLEADVTELCDADGKPVAYVLSAEEYRALCYAWAHAEASTPEAQAEIKASEEAYARGECISSEQLFAEIDAFVRRRAAS